MNKIHIGKCENLPEWTVHFQIVPPHIQLSHNYSVHFDSSVEKPFGSIFSEPNNTLITIYGQDFAQSWSLGVSSLRKNHIFRCIFSINTEAGGLGRYLQYFILGRSGRIYFQGVLKLRILWKGYN